MKINNIESNGFYYLYGFLVHKLSRVFGRVRFRRSLFVFAALAALVPACALCDDRGVGKRFKNNPSATMKQYHIKNIDPITADSIETVVEKEMKENLALDEKIAAWADAGFTIKKSGGGRFLDPTPNAPSDDPRIKALADSLKGATPRETAGKIFDFVNKATDFDFYMNSKKGALGALDSKKANCCDQAHLTVALLRASGIPARYSHCKPCRFLTSGMVTGHVWAEAMIDGSWTEMDTTSDRNNVGAVNSFEKLGNSKYYSELPF